MTDETQANAWKPVVSGIKAHGAFAIAQMLHAGAPSQGNRFRDTTVGPSHVQPKGEQMTFYHGMGRSTLPAAITDEQIADAINGFAQSAGRAIAVAGFDAIEIHGANGYLLDQFLTDYANTRADRWGGATENRVRLILETFKAVRAKVGPKTPVGVRILSRQGERLPSQVGPCGAQCRNHLRQPHGRRRELHPCHRIRGVDAGVHAGRSIIDTLRQALRTQAAILANGSLRNVGQVMAALEDGADIITVGRVALANPDLPRRLSVRGILNDFDPTILGPIANIKESELAM